MCYEIKGEGEERKNLIQQNQPSNKHIPVMGSPKSKGDVGQELPHPSSFLGIQDFTKPKLWFLAINMELHLSCLLLTKLQPCDTC